MLKRGLLFILFALMSVQQVAAIHTLFDLDELNLQLSNNAILCMYQDVHGLIWVGTYDGLNLYDGKSVSTFRYKLNDESSLLGNIIHGIREAEDGYIWVSTQRGLNKFSLNEQHSVEAYPELKRVDLMTRDTQGNSWMINRDNQVRFYNASTKTMHDIAVDNISIANICAFFTCEGGNICIIQQDGSLQHLRLNTNHREEEQPTYSLTVTSEIIHNKEIERVFIDDQIYLLDENNDLFIYNPSKQMKILLLNLSDQIKQYGSISSLQNFNNELYLSFMYSGVLKFDVSSSVREPQLIDMSTGVFGLMKDRNQNAMWVGTDGQGVKLYCAENNSIGNILLSDLPFMARRPIRAIYTDEEQSLWVGTKGDGLIRIQNYHQYANMPIPSSTVEQFTNTAENAIYSLRRSSYNKNILWIGTSTGVLYYDYDDNQVHTLQLASYLQDGITDIHGFCETNDSTLWLTSNGLCEVIIDKTTHPYQVKQKTSYPFLRDSTWVNDEFYAMFYDNDSTLYLGSKGGYGVDCFNIYQKNSSSLPLYTTVGDILSLHHNDTTMLYIGTSAGLIVVENWKHDHRQISQFTLEDGLLNDMTHGILEDEFGIIWFSTNKGLVKYNPSNGEFFNINSRNNKVTEFSDGAYYHCPYTGRLFFGGVNGLLWIEPQQNSQGSTYVPEFLFTKLNYNGDSQTLYDYGKDPSKKLKLASYQNTFEISFAVLDYINVNNYDYIYKLENYNNEWVSLAKENKIRFTNIPAGEYTLKVCYKDDVLFKGNTTYELPIVVKPPWYRSPWSYIIYALLLLIAAVASFVIARKAFRLKQAALLRREKKRQKEKMYESKLNFISNITHELLTPVTLINGAVEQLRKLNGNPDSKRYYEILSDSTTSLHELIQEMLFVRKIEDADVELVVSKIALHELFQKQLSGFSVLAERNKIKINKTIPQQLYWNTYEKGVSMVVSNLLSNALKYTPTEGVIDLVVEGNTETLSIIVRNSGKGIEESKLASVFGRYHILENTDINANNQLTARNGLGLYICYSMVKLAKGDITVDSVLDQYTEFRVTLPNLTLMDATADTQEVIEEVLAVTPTAKTIVPMPEIVGDTSSILPTVLIVDDNSDIVTLVADILAPYYAPLRANGHKQAMAHLKNKVPDLIITDIMMPEVNGYTLIKMLRENKHYKHIPIIALSAKVENADKTKAYDLGADAYITKPFSSEILISVVRRFISNKEEVKRYYESEESLFELEQGNYLHKKDRLFMDKFFEVLKENISLSQLGPEFIASEMKISKQTLYRQIKKITKSSPSELIKHYKLTYAAKLLISTNLSVKEIIYKIGVSNKSYFYNEFQKKYQLSPKQYKESVINRGKM